MWASTSADKVALPAPEAANPMRTERRATIQDLRLAIDCLPQVTRIAMLEGIRANEIIVGAYTDENGICPMLAAHRAGGRTALISFARAWDRFAFRDSRSRRARKASERELLVLRTHLEASLLDDELPAGTLIQAIAEHRELLERRAQHQREQEDNVLERAPGLSPEPEGQPSHCDRRRRSPVRPRGRRRLLHRAAAPALRR